MVFIYIDESGDLGVNKSKGGYFIVTAVRVDKDEIDITLRRIPKKIRRKKLNKKMREMPELKFSNSSERIRTAFLKAAAKEEIGVFCLVIRKTGNSIKLKKEMHLIYNYYIKLLLDAVFASMGGATTLTICLDRCMSLAQREKFESYIKTEFYSLFRQIPKVEIRHDVSHSNAALQVADFVCSAFGYKYNTAGLKEDCSKYTDIIRAKIKLERVIK